MSTNEIRTVTCDRCNETVRMSKGLDRPETWDTIGYPGIIDAELDLCPKCLKALDDWWEAPKNATAYPKV